VVRRDATENAWPFALVFPDCLYNLVVEVLGDQCSD